MTQLEKACKLWDWEDAPALRPTYFADLNACARLEERLTEEQWEHFADLLLFRQHPDAGYSNYTSVRRACTVGPAEHAECLGLALGLWQAGEEASR